MEINFKENCPIKSNFIRLILLEDIATEIRIHCARTIVNEAPKFLLRMELFNLLSIINCHIYPQNMVNELLSLWNI